MDVIQDATKAIMPETAKKFLGSVKPRPVGEMVMYVAILGILGVIGTVIGLSVVGVTLGYGIFSATVKYPMQWALIQGVLGLVGTVIAVIGAGMAFSMLSQGFIGKQVSTEEGVTLAGLAATPLLLAGIFNIIPGIGSLLILLAALYSAFLFYQASGVRFGADKAVAATIVFIAAYFVIGIIAGIIIGAIMLAVYNPFAVNVGYGGLDLYGY